MKKNIRYHFFATALIIFCFSCNQKILNRNMSLWRMDRIPYGTKYAFDNLSFIFPHADIRAGYGYPDFENEAASFDTTRALIVVSPQFAPDPEQLESMIQFAAKGNQVFISAFYFDDSILQILKLKKYEYNFDEGDSTEIRLLDPVNQNWRTYSYPGKSYDPYFVMLDSGHTTVLGKDVHDNPNFVRIAYPNGGAIFIHLNPLAFTNFFLLHKNNSSYYDIALSYMPEKVGVVEWSDYYRYRHNPDNFSALQFILKNRSLRWAFWLTLLLFGILFLIESKRKQRSIPAIAPLRNASEDFVKTVGRLYFQQKNNQNLSAKMITAFLENIRNAYNLSTSLLNDDFIRKLSVRTGRPVQEVSQLIQQIHSARLNPDMSDQELMDLHQQLNQFNKPA